MKWDFKKLWEYLKFFNKETYVYWDKNHLTDYPVFLKYLAIWEKAIKTVKFLTQRYISIN